MNRIAIMKITAILLFSQRIQLKAQEMQDETPKISIFPAGNKLPEKFAKYFTGNAYLAIETNPQTNENT